MLRHPWWQRVRHHADTAFLMLAAMITGVSGLVAPGTKSRVITGSLPGWMQVVWYSGLLGGGLLGGFALILGGKTGLIVERPARWLLAFLCCAFGVAVIAAVGLRGVAGMAFIGLFAAACVARAWEIRWELHAPASDVALQTELETVRAEMAALRAELPPRPG